MERKSGSSSRSPSLSRRPSLKEKKGSSIAKSKKKSSAGGKKERWLLTRKTWRYMTDAVGNLLPEHHRSGSSRRGSTLQTTTTTAGVATAVDASSSSPWPSGANTATAAAASAVAIAGIPSPGTSAGPSRSSMSPTNGSSSISVAHTNYPQPFPMYQPLPPPTTVPPSSITPDDIPALEKNFEKACTKEKKFLLWTRTRPKGLSGPALRDLKAKQKSEKDDPSATSSSAAGATGGSSAPILTKSASAFGNIFSSHPFHYTHSSQHRRSDASGKEHTLSSSEYFSPEEEAIDDDDYDEYDNDEEQVTVRERRKSSAASSSMSILGGTALSFFRPLSTMSTVSTSTASDSSYAMVISSTGVQKNYRSTGIQTEPFPEELLMKLRLQSVQEEQKLQQSLLQYQQQQQQQQFHDEYNSTLSQLPGSYLSQQHSSTIRTLRQHTGMTQFDRMYLDEIRETENGNGHNGSNNGSNKMPSTPTGTETAIDSSTRPMTLEQNLQSQFPSTIPALAAGSKGFSCPSEKESSESGRESQEKILDSQSCTGSSGTSGLSPLSVAKSGEGGEAESSMGTSGSVADSASTTADQTDKKSEESGYSSSISDTVMRYLRMVRKNSKADNKETIDKFKTVNYDRSLRYIKSKNVSVEEALEHEKNKAMKQQQSSNSEPSATTSPEIGKLTPGEKGSSDSGAVKKGSGVVCPTSAVSSATKVSSGAASVASVQVSSQQISTSSSTPLSTASVSSASVGSSGNTTTTSSSISPILSSSSNPPTPKPPSQQSVILPSVGIQAGESLIRFLRQFHPGRKLSDFSSTTSYFSSESPTAETASPRYSIATTVMSSVSDNELYGHNQATGTITSGIGVAGDIITATPFIPVTSRSSFDMCSGADSSEFDDVFNNYHQQVSPRQSSSSLLHHRHQPQQSELSSHPSAFSSFPPTSGTSTTTLINTNRKSTSTTASTYSFSQIFSSQQNVTSGIGLSGKGEISATSVSGTASSSSTSVKISSSTPNTPTIGPSTSNIMKSFFSSSPFSSSSSKNSRLKKPMSTTSLVSSSTASPSLLKTSVPPPTTSSSPNLLSLIHSSASSSLSSFMGRSSRDSSHQHHHHLQQSGSGLGHDGGTDGGSGSGRDIATSSGYSFGSGTICSSGSNPTVHSFSVSKQQSSGGKAPSVSFKGSLSPQKGQMTLPISIGQSRSPSDTSYAPEPGSRSGGGGSYGFLGMSGGHSSGGSTMSGFSSAVMQKSKSSSSVLPQYGSSVGEKDGAGATSAGATASSGTSRLMSKSRIFKSRSKSSTRASSSSASCSWTPQGKCKWKSITGRQIILESTTILNLNESERLTLQEVALDKLRAINLGVDVKIPKEKASASQPKPKRRPYLLKKKALSTGFFESGSKREETKVEAVGGSGLVFGIALAQCVANDRLRCDRISTISPQPEWEQTHKRSQNGSRNSVSSTCEASKEEKEQQPVAPIAVPSIILACVKHLESFGLHTTGIFRVSTSLKRIRQLREEIDGGKNITFGEEHSPHDVAALLKEFLRDLPEPLLCRDLYQPFLKTLKVRNRKLQLEAVQHLVQLLPVPNRDTLATLLRFFAKVVENAADTRTKTGEILPGNKMEGYSLSTLIAPNILPCMPTEGNIPAMESATLTRERRESIDVVNYLISNYKELFEVPSELLHDVYLHMMDTHPEVIEGILKQRSGVNDDALDELETTSSVFEGSECGELADIEEATASARMFRRREDLLHEGGGKGGHGYTKEDRTRDRGSTKREGSKDRSGGLSDVEKQQSGGESDSSSTKSTSRWFRRSRGDHKTRTSSDSGGDNAKGKKRDSSLHESKRATSLDSVNLMKESSYKVTSSKTSGEPVVDRQRSCSDQSLKVPENMSRRQSSPVLEGSGGVITASLKIPVPVPLNIDDTDIPFIEEDNNEPQRVPQYHSHYHIAEHSQQETSPHVKPRCRSASTDSSAFKHSMSTSHTTTPISSPLRQPSSEVSSPVFSPPASPPYDPATFPYEEMTARIFLGSASPATRQRSQHSPGASCSSALQTTVTTTTTTSSVSFKDMTKDQQPSPSSSTSSTPTPKVEKSPSSLNPSPVSSAVTSSSSSSAGATTSSQAASVYASSSGGYSPAGQSAPVATTGAPQPSTSTSSSPYVISSGEVKGLGKETKGANIAGLIKSKTADFEKLAKSSSGLFTTPTTPISSIAPKMRLRSQENIMLKQQFLLRQQQADKTKSHGKVIDKDRSNSPIDVASSSPGSGHIQSRSLTRRRHQLTASSSATAIVSSSAETPSAESSSHSSSQSHAQSQSQTLCVSNKPQGSPTSSATPPPGSSPTRWKRSEIISSRHQSQSSQDPETFV